MARRRHRIVGLFSTVISGISTSLVLILLGMVLFFVTLTREFSRSLRENFAVEVMLDDSISQGEAYRLQKELRAMPCTRYTNYVSKEKGTREMMEALDGSPTDFLGASPVPAEFEVFLHEAYACEDSLALIVPKLQKRAYVTDVTYPKDAIDVVSYYIPMVWMGLLVVALLLSLVSFELINNIVRMGIYSRRFSIHTMKLVGAKWSYIRRPFLLRAMGTGFLAALVADGVLVCGYYLFKQQDAYLSSLMSDLEMGSIVGVVTVCGVLLTLLSAYFSVNRHLRMRGGDIYVR